MIQLMVEPTEALHHVYIDELANSSFAVLHPACVQYKSKEMTIRFKTRHIREIKTSSSMTKIVEISKETQTKKNGNQLREFRITMPNGRVSASEMTPPPSPKWLGIDV